MIDLASIASLATSLFVKITIGADDSSIVDDDLLFSDHDRAYTIAGDTYVPLGTLMAATTTSAELRPSPGEVNITITGIPNARLQNIINTRIKGSDVVIYRAFFDPVTGANLPIPGNGGSNVVKRFEGRVISVSIQEEWDTIAASSSITIQFNCASVVALMANKFSGRKTNPVDQQALFPTDTSMSDVPALANSNFNWGAPQ
jgi:hypothetical protein